jgi:hypothetical protein
MVFKNVMPDDEYSLNCLIINKCKHLLFNLLMSVFGA